MDLSGGRTLCGVPGRGPRVGALPTCGGLRARRASERPALGGRRRTAPSRGIPAFI